MSKYDQFDWLPIFCREFHILLLFQFFEGAEFSIHPRGETRQQKPCKGDFTRAHSFINKRDVFYLWGKVSSSPAAFLYFTGDSTTVSSVDMKL